MVRSSGPYHRGRRNTWTCNVYSYISSVTWACVIYSYTSSVVRMVQCLSIYIVCDLVCIEFLVCRYFRSRTTKVRKVQCLAKYLVCDRGYSTLINPSTRAPLWSDPVAYLLGTFPNNYIEYKNQMIKSRKYWVSSRFINIIYRTLTFFSTNDRDRNINIAFENSCKIKTINIKANWTCCSTIHSLSVPLFLFFHSLSLRYEILELKWKRSM